MFLHRVLSVTYENKHERRAMDLPQLMWKKKRLFTPSKPIHVDVSVLQSSTVLVQNMGINPLYKYLHIIVELLSGLADNL